MSLDSRNSENENSDNKDSDNTDPLTLFAEDRQRAWDAQDPSAALCTVANVNEQGEPELRTLVLRDVDGDLAIFINSTSPKWPHIQQRLALHTYWPSVQVQFRMRMQCHEIEPAVVRDSWRLRPQPPRLMDWLYHERQPQSSPIADRDTLLNALNELESSDPMEAPPQARGLKLVAYEVERLDLTQANGVHDRRHFTRTSEGWKSTTLVP